MDGEQLRAELQGAGLGRIAGAIIDRARPSVGLRTMAQDESAMPLGGSKLGGSPDLPRAVRWPEWKGKSQSFIAQLNLADIGPYAPPDILPRVGILYFFYDMWESPWGFDPKDRGAWTVLYHDGDSSGIERRAIPSALREPDRLWFNACALRSSSELTPPSWFSEILAGVGMTREEQDRYSEWWFALKERQEPVHRLLGLPYLIQNDMEIECQLVSHGIYMGDSSAFQDPRADGLAAGASDWQLLLQVDSDEAAEMMWGDSGMIYYWVRRQDLEVRDFSNAWLVLQCY